MNSQVIIFTALCLTTLTAAGQYSLTVASRVARSKEKAYGEWKDYPTRCLETLTGYHAAPVPLDKWGGRTDVRLQATGYFHAVKVRDRWWTVDPEGHPFINRSVTYDNIIGVA